MLLRRPVSRNGTGIRDIHFNARGSKQLYFKYADTIKQECYLLQCHFISNCEQPK